jgi:predicted O-methyltransferase YrrM
VYFNDDQALDEYLDQHHSPENELLSELNRQTHLKVLQPRMLSGSLQGRFLAMMAKIIQPRFVLEIGTYTGYSALCLAEGLLPEGELHSIEVNDELESIINSFWHRSPYRDQLHLHLGSALEILPRLNQAWDLIFIDAEKTEYWDYYQLLIPRLKSGAILLFDNVLWSGKVLRKPAPKDDATQSLLKLNKALQDDPRVENMILPLRDGLMMLRVK